MVAGVELSFEAIVNYDSVNYTSDEALLIRVVSDKIDIDFICGKGCSGDDMIKYNPNVFYQLNTTEANLDHQYVEWIVTPSNIEFKVIITPKLAI